MDLTQKIKTLVVMTWLIQTLQLHMVFCTCDQCVFYFLTVSEFCYFFTLSLCLRINKRSAFMSRLFDFHFPCDILFLLKLQIQITHTTQLSVSDLDLTELIFAVQPAPCFTVAIYHCDYPVMNVIWRTWWLLQLGQGGPIVLPCSWITVISSNRH